MGGFANDAAGNTIVWADNIDFSGNVIVSRSITTNGQLLIGSTAAPNIRTGTLTSPSGSVTIGYSSPNITLDVTTGFTWTDVTTATQALSVANGYITDRGAGVTYTLPATAALGDMIKIIGKLGLTTVAQNAGQQIIMSSADSTVGVTGSIVGTDEGDCVELICTTPGASTVWTAANFVGNWTSN